MIGVGLEAHIAWAEEADVRDPRDTRRSGFGVMMTANLVKINLVGMYPSKRFVLALRANTHHAGEDAPQLLDAAGERSLEMDWIDLGTIDSKAVRAAIQAFDERRAVAAVWVEVLNSLWDGGTEPDDGENHPEWSIQAHRLAAERGAGHA